MLENMQRQPLGFTERAEAPHTDSQFKSVPREKSMIVARALTQLSGT